MFLSFSGKTTHICSLVSLLVYFLFPTNRISKVQMPFFISSCLSASVQDGSVSAKMTVWIHHVPNLPRSLSSHILGVFSKAHYSHFLPYGQAENFIKSSFSSSLLLSRAFSKLTLAFYYKQQVETKPELPCFSWKSPQINIQVCRLQVLCSTQKQISIQPSL